MLEYIFFAILLYYILILTAGNIAVLSAAGILLLDDVLDLLAGLAGQLEEHSADVGEAAQGEHLVESGRVLVPVDGAAVVQGGDVVVDLLVVDQVRLVSVGLDEQYEQTLQRAGSLTLEVGLQSLSVS